VVAIDGCARQMRVDAGLGRKPPFRRRTHLAKNLLKSETHVDLVHFTILRPRKNQDGNAIKRIVADRVFDPLSCFSQKINDP